jgi:hypothetical protein
VTPALICTGFPDEDGNVLASGVPVSSLGKCTGQYWINTAAPSAIMTCFFDGSEGHDPGKRWLTLAGLIASEDLWAAFDGSWRAMLRNRYPLAPYLHMYQMMAGKDPFERVNGWTEPKVKALVFDAVQLLSQIDKTAFRSFICTIDLEAYGRLVTEGYGILSAPSVCAQSCLGALFEWYADRFSIEEAYVFYDRGEPFFQQFKADWLRERTPRDKPRDPESFWDAIADVHDVDMDRHAPVQACDLLAWATTRSRSDRSYSWLSGAIWDCIPQSKLIIDEQLMRERHNIRR